MKKYFVPLICSILLGGAACTTVAPPPSETLTSPELNQKPVEINYVWPTSSKIITQYFADAHPSIDIAGKINDPVLAAAPGIVETAECGWNEGRGCYIIINHDQGIKTLYQHLGGLLIKAGENAEVGQKIAHMGRTGNLKGSDLNAGILHFEIQKDEAYLDPLNFFPENR